MQNLITEGLTGSFTATAMRSTSVPYTDFELLIGKFPGPMGCCFTILTAVCALYLISRKTISGCVFFSEIITVLGIAALRGGAFGLKSAAAGGMLIFGAAIFSAHRGSAPKTAAERLAFGLITGLFVSAVAAMSSLENPAVYAAIICAPVARLTDKPRRLFLRRRRAKRIKETEAAQSGGAENG